MNFKNFTLSFVAAFVALFAPVPAVAQVSLTTTTLSAAVGNGPAGTPLSFNVASATGISAPSFSVPNVPGANQTLLFVDKEAMFVTAVNGTYISAIRGYAGSTASAHVSGATVYVGNPSQFILTDKSGACTSTTEPFLPAINTVTGNGFDCSTTGGQWFQTLNGTQHSAAVGLVSLFCTGTTGSAETEYLNDAACSGATTATASTVMSAPGVLRNLRVRSSAVAVGGSAKDVATVYKNGSATSITCTIAAAGTTCSDTSHSVAVAAGDYIQVQFVTATSDTAANVSAGVDKF